MLALGALLLASPAWATATTAQPAAQPTAGTKPAPAPKPARTRPVLVEMFVSQSCSSCRPADALLLRLAATDKHILPLSLDVTYWNHLGWHDSDATDATTTRQFWYAGLSGNSNVYTPEAVVDGKAQLVGSDEKALTAAIKAARAAPAGNVPVRITGGAMITIDVAAGHGAGQVTLFGYDARHDTHVGGGENRGTVVSEVNVVRSISPLGGWNGLHQTYTLTHPAGAHVAVLVQAPDGAVLGLGNL